MREITPERITIQREDDGFYWLVVPNATICLNNNFGPIVRKNFLKWAEEEFNAVTFSEEELNEDEKSYQEEGGD